MPLKVHANVKISVAGTILINPWTNPSTNSFEVTIFLSKYNNATKTTEKAAPIANPRIASQFANASPILIPPAKNPPV